VPENPVTIKNIAVLLLTKPTFGTCPRRFAQVVAYAKAKGCQEAVLVYPSALSNPLNAEVGDIRIRSLVFSLDGDLDEAGRAFVQNVLQTESLYFS
jgi:hypothetical protein